MSDLSEAYGAVCRAAERHELHQTRETLLDLDHAEARYEFIRRTDIENADYPEDEDHTAEDEARLGSYLDMEEAVTRDAALYAEGRYDGR